MKMLLRLIAAAALAATLVPSILVASGAIGLETQKTVMFAGMILWFATAPFVMARDRSR